MRKVVFKKQVHSCWATASSNDVELSILIEESDLDFDPKEESVIRSNRYEMLNDEKVRNITQDEEFMIVRLFSDETFNRGNARDSFHNTSPFKQLIFKYDAKGWETQYTKHEEEIAFWKRHEQRRAQERKEAGYVLWEAYDERTAEDFKGGFSDEFFNSEKIKNYISDGKCVFGWIGHEERRAEVDQAIEEGLRKRGLSVDQMFNWISSSDGRHFGDSMSFYDNVRDQLDEVSLYLNSIYNLCIIYSSPEHRGTYGSTKEISEKYENLGLLLPEKTSDYSSGVHLASFWTALFEKKVDAGLSLTDSERAMFENMKEKVEQQNIVNEAKNLINGSL